MQAVFILSTFREHFPLDLSAVEILHITDNSRIDMQIL